MTEEEATMVTYSEWDAIIARSLAASERLRVAVTDLNRAIGRMEAEGHADERD